MGEKVLITGITGFLGSHLAAYLLDQGFTVIGLKRSSSDTSRCLEYLEKVCWLRNDVNGWQEEVSKSKPDIILHAAWSGVTADSRNDLKQQLTNLTLLADLLSIANESKVQKFICLGSQAEYGLLNDIAHEEDQLNAESAYGIVKIMASKMVKLFSNANSINWYWLRVFSVFGEKESPAWLIPSVINQLLSNKQEIEFSAGTQKYAYLYINDLVKMVFAIIKKTPVPLSGIYNISAINAVPIRKTIEDIKILSGNTNSTLSFGKLPLRSGQSTYIEGDMSKFLANISPIAYADFSSSMAKTIEFYKRYTTNDEANKR